MGVCDVPVISSVCDAVGEGAASLVAAPFDWLAQAMGGAAGWLFEAVWSVFDTTTMVDVTKPGYLAVYNLLFGIAVFVMLIFFCLQLITGLVRRDPTALTRAAVGLAKSVLGSFVVITLAALMLEVVDQLCLGIVQATGETTESMGDKIALLAAGLAGINIAAPGVGAIITIFLAGLAITAAAIVWLSLLVRKALLLVAVVFAPLAFSGASWDATRGWIGKWAMFVIALICSKLVLVVMFLVAVTQVSAPIDADLASISEPIAGVVLMAMAAFAPYLTYKFIAFVGFDIYHAIGSEQDAKNALNRPIPVLSKTAGGEPKKVLDGTSDSGTTGGRPAKGSKTPPPPKTTPAATGTTPSSGTTGGSSAGTGGGGVAAGGGSAAAAGPVAAGVTIGAAVVKGAATAGPKAGTALAGQAEQTADAAGQTPSAPAAPPAQASPATSPPRTPSNDPSPPPPSQPSKQAPPPAPQPPKEQ